MRGAVAKWAGWTTFAPALLACTAAGGEGSTSGGNMPDGGATTSQAGATSSAIDTGKIVSTELEITNPDYVALFDDVETELAEGCVEAEPLRSACACARLALNVS